MADRVGRGQARARSIVRPPVGEGGATPYGWSMFTGIVEHMGRVAEVRSTPSGKRLVVDSCAWAHQPRAGDSIGVNGCCLTVVGELGAGSHASGVLAFDVVPETLAKTTLGSWRVGEGVNLEHAATASTLLGGHVVQGHVDGVGRVEENGQIANSQMANGEKEKEGEWRLRVALPRELMEYMVPKGSVSIDGVSLTLAAVDVARDAIEIALIPTTLEKTTLGGRKAGDGVNVEADVMAKTVVHYLRHFAKREG